MQREARRRYLRISLWVIRRSTVAAQVMTINPYRTELRRYTGNTCGAAYWVSMVRNPAQKKPAIYRFVFPEICSIRILLSMHILIFIITKSPAGG